MPISFLEEGQVEEWDATIDINIKGVLYGINAVLPHMLKRKYGHIITTSSTGGLQTVAGASVYCGTKHGVKAIMDSLRQEVVKGNWLGFCNSNRLVQLSLAQPKSII